MKHLTLKRTALLSLILNFAYSLYHFIAGIAHYSWWFITLGAYYIILGVMRFGVLLSSRRTKDAQFILQFTGSLLIALSVTLFGVTCLSFFSEQGIPHHEITMIAIAVYTFTRITLAI
ncbi:MAG: hypothetical protein IKK29_03505, partial [Christensenellaceae bacterium]|nr:hypothetical protein [Christensenellaceae bacterium]